MEKLIMPQSLTKAMASVAEAENQKKAKLIDAQSNYDAALTFRQASDLLGGNPITLQLQYLDVLKIIAAENNELILMPNEVLDHFKKI